MPAWSPLLARIDDRLIHGQVVVGCCEPLGARRILLVDDEVAHDELQQRIYRAGVPPRVELEFIAVARSAARLDELAASDGLDRVVIVVSRARVMSELLAAGVRFRSVQVGGAHLRAGATELVAGVFLDPEDRAALGQLLDAGTEVFIQPVARSSRTPVDRSLLDRVRG